MLGPAEGTEIPEVGLAAESRAASDLPALRALPSSRGRHHVLRIRDWLRETRAGRYSLAVLMPAMALGARYLLVPVLGDATPFILLFPAVLLVAWWAGRGPALVACAISCLGSLVLFTQPRFSPFVTSWQDILNIALLAAALLLIVGVSMALRDARERAERLVESDRQLLVEQRELVRVRDAFANMLAHELRTPITVIMGQALVAARQPSLTPSLAEAIGDIAIEAERLHLLTEDLLVLNRGDASIEFVPEPILVQRILSRVVTTLRQRLPGILIEMDVAPDLSPASADSTYVEQILRNLLSNAIKYGRPDAWILVAAEQTEGCVRVSITNDGEPVPEGDETRIFELFYRSAATASGRSGAGVGLYVTRSLATAMDGSVWCERLPTGMRFHLQLPIAVADAVDR
jgi:signal transduction histidine kinase